MTVLDWGLIGRAAAPSVVALVVAALVARAAELDGGGAALAFLAWAWVTFALSGFAAGRRRLDLPMAHGAAAALVASVVVLALAAVGPTGSSGPDGPGSGVAATTAATVTALALAAGAGAGGGLAADWLHRRGRRSRPGSAVDSSGLGESAG